MKISAELKEVKSVKLLSGDRGVRIVFYTGDVQALKLGMMPPDTRFILDVDAEANPTLGA